MKPFRPSAASPQAIAWRQTASASTACAWRWWSGISPTKSFGKKTGKVAVVFARSAIQKLIEEFTGGALKDKIDYCFEVRDDLGTGYWRGGALGEGKLMAAFELQACGYLKIGAALDALEEQERFLGAAFYYLLRRSLYRWIRIYDHTDAECLQRTTA